MLGEGGGSYLNQGGGAYQLMKFLWYRYTDRDIKKDIYSYKDG